MFDRLRNYSIRTRLAQAAATNLARDYEAAWRRQCAEWIEAEWRDGPVLAPVAIFHVVVVGEMELMLLVDSHGGGHPGLGWRQWALLWPVSPYVLSPRGSLAQCLDAAAPY